MDLPTEWIKSGDGSRAIYWRVDEDFEVEITGIGMTTAFLDIDTIVAMIDLVSLAESQEIYTKSRHLVKAGNYHNRLVDTLRSLMVAADNIEGEHIIGSDELESASICAEDLLEELGEINNR